jgi:hypothetical protein
MRVHLSLTVRAVLAASFLAALSVPSGAQDENMPVLGTAIPSWEGYCRPPGWVTYKLTYATISEDFVGAVRIEAGGVFGAEVEIPKSSRKEITIPVMIRPDALTPRVYLEDENGDEIEKSSWNLPSPKILEKGEVLTGIVTPGEAEDWLDLSRYLPKAKVLTFGPEDVPDMPESLEPFDIILLPGAPGFSNEQMAAVWTWIQGGGVLVLPGPEALEGPAREIYFRWLFPDFEQGGPIDPGRILERWGSFDHRAVFLESLDLDPERAVESPLGEGRIAFREVGDGGLAFLTAPYPGKNGEDVKKEAVQELWTTLVTKVLRFGDDSPPNPRRRGLQSSSIEPGLYGFFETASWPPERLQWAHSVLVIYSCVAAAAIMMSFLFLIRKRIHFALAASVCLLGSAAVLIFSVPRKTAVGQTLDMVTLENGKVFAEQRKILHIASLSSSRVECSFPAKDWRILPMESSRKSSSQDRVKWTFGTRENAKALAIQGIRLEEGQRFLAVVSKGTTVLGRLTTRWKVPGRLVMINEINSPMVDAVLVRNGKILPLFDFEFGQPPREVDLSRGWIPMLEHFEALGKKDGEAGRILAAYIEGYYTAGELVFVAFLKKKGLTFESDQLDRQVFETPLVTMRVPQPGE